MGRRYAKELEELALTYDWATSCPIDDFANAIEAIPLILYRIRWLINCCVLLGDAP